ncbi:hypothetical protein [Haloechinothrix salitolerans]|uniref:Uncharacterized protein n=1 Tax=Haloechinothrix salitolerans TaxID=926830 RepID=A0ABW2BX21_9PSEU
MDELKTFAALGESWSIKLRRPLVALSDQDATRLNDRLGALELHSMTDVLPQYARWWHAASPS